MSYAGTYGADETCSHGSYWRSCMAGCSLVGPRATAEQIRAARDRQRAEQRKAEAERKRKADERWRVVQIVDGFGRVIEQTDCEPVAARPVPESQPGHPQEEK